MMPWQDPEFWITSALFVSALVLLSRPLWKRESSGCGGCAASALKAHLDAPEKP